MKIKHNRTRKIKKKNNKNKNNTSIVNNDNDDYKNNGDYANIGNIKKILIKDDVGCITVNNSFEENFKNFFKIKANFFISIHFIFSIKSQLI
jgi:hypothetical protein